MLVRQFIVFGIVLVPHHNRIEQTEIDFLKRFLGKTSEYDVPVIVVLTQSYSKRDAQKLKKRSRKRKLAYREYCACFSRKL